MTSLFNSDCQGSDDHDCFMLLWGAVMRRNKFRLYESTYNNNFMALYLLQQTNAQIHITIFSLYIMFTATCFNTSVSSSGSSKTCTLLSYVSP